MTATMVDTLINGRWTLALPEHRAAREQWATGWERERLDSMAANLRPGDLVFDIGAEEGDFPALWASWGCDVVLVEPNPRVWPNIRAIFEANELVDRLRAYYVGFAGDEDRPNVAWGNEHGGGRQTWPLCADGPVIGDHGFLVIVERPEVSMTTIDWLAGADGPPDAITIDVEGAELRVLRGAERTLREHRPLVWVSVHLDERWMAEKFPGEGGDAVHEFMAGLGYRGHHLATDHEAHWLFAHPDGRPVVLAG